MADMKCMKCGEPWDWFHIRDEVLANEEHYQRAKTKGGWFNDRNEGDPLGSHSSFHYNGMPPKGFVIDPRDATWRFSPGPYIEECPNCIDKEVEPDEKAMYRAAIAEILGDDIDGFIAECEDFGL